MTPAERDLVRVLSALLDSDDANWSAKAWLLRRAEAREVLSRMALREPVPEMAVIS